MSIPFICQDRDDPGCGGEPERRRQRVKLPADQAGTET
jgi:hypothetical protein